MSDTLTKVVRSPDLKYYHVCNDYSLEPATPDEDLGSYSCKGNTFITDEVHGTLYEDEYGDIYLFSTPLQQDLTGLVV